MKNETILYEYLYQLILSQIHCGTLQDGQRFPSLAELCRLYNVGITTARRVTGMLAQAGYLKTSERRRPVVVWKADTQTYREAVLRRRESVLDIYAGFKLILPELQLKGAELYRTPEKLTSIIAAIKDDMGHPEFYRQTSLFFLELLTPYNNRILYDLQTDSENFTNIPYLPLSGLKDNYSATPAGARAALTLMVHQMEAGDYEALKRKLYQVYDDSHDRTTRYLDALKAQYTGKKPESEPQSFTLKNRADLYTVLARRLWLRIQEGKFNGCKYLPSIPDLMEEYSVSQATALRAVALLNDIGIVSTLDKKGTVIAEQGSPLSPVRIDRKSISENLILFIEAMQILAICSGDLACAVLTGMDDAALASSLQTWDCMGESSSAAVSRTLLLIFRQNAPYRCLSAIFEQLDYLLIWGHYLERAPLPVKGIEHKTAVLASSLRSAMASRDTYSFSRLVHSLFQDEFETARQIMILYGISEDSLPVVVA